MIITPPRTQERIAAGPASCADASSAPNSQPEPMIEPTPANSSPVRPTWRFSPLVSSSGCSADCDSGSGRVVVTSAAYPVGGGRTARRTVVG